MTGTPRQTFRIDEILWKKFQKRCNARGYSASDVLRAFILRVLDGSIKVESVKPSGSKKGVELTSYPEQVLKWLKSEESLENETNTE